MPSQAPTCRTSWLLIILLLVSGALGACGKPAAEPEQPPVGPDESRPSPTQPTAPSQEQAEQRKQLQAALNAATDLFNRGENDLACDAVKRAQDLASAPGTTSGTTLEQQLTSYRAACEPF